MEPAGRDHRGRYRVGTRQGEGVCLIRQDIGVVVDPSFFFGSDSLAVRVIMRIGFGYPHHAAVCKISLAGGS